MGPLTRLLVAVILFASAVAVDAAMQINACGQTVPAGQTGLLAVDLVCTGSAAPAIILDDRARVYFHRHVVTGGSSGVRCLGKCAVRGPGEITGAGHGVYSLNSFSHIDVRQIHIHDNTGNGIFRDNGIGNLTLQRVDIDHNYNGITASSTGDTIAGTRVSVSDNVGNGIVARNAVFLRLTMTNNGAPGLVSEQGGARLIHSVLTGNAADVGGMDVLTYLMPVLVNTTCGWSYQVPFDGPLPFPGDPSWGVCTND
jgi:hypothetical protein